MGSEPVGSAPLVAAMTLSNAERQARFRERARNERQRTFDAISAARRVLFDAGGLRLERDPERPGKGKMVAEAPEHQARADAYNALADVHGPEPL